MRRTILGILVLVTTAGCGTESRLGTYGDPSTGDIVTQAAGNVWATARPALERLKAARYIATLVSQRCSKATTENCDLTSQTLRNVGTFSLSPASLSSELLVKLPVTENASKADTVVEMRELPDGALYSLDHSSATNCWMSWDKTFTGTFESAFRSGLAVLRTAEVDYDLPATASTVELAAKANALAVVRTLGLPQELDKSYGITEEVRRTLSTKTVSINLKVGPGGSPITFQVDGRQVASEIQPGAISLASGYLATVQNAYSSFSIKDFGTAPSVVAPPADQTLAKNAPQSANCGG